MLFIKLWAYSVGANPLYKGSLGRVWNRHFPYLFALFSFKSSRDQSVDCTESETSGTTRKQSEAYTNFPERVRKRWGENPKVLYIECDVYGNIAKKRESLSHHLNYQHLLFCTICSNSFATKGKLEQHRRTSSDVRLIFIFPGLRKGIQESPKSWTAFEEAY